MGLERPDSPCIARCTTAVGDNVCRGCGRSFTEISNWWFMDTLERERVWQCLPERQLLLAVAEAFGGQLDLVWRDGQEWGVICHTEQQLSLRLQQQNLLVCRTDGSLMSFPVDSDLKMLVSQLQQFAYGTVPD